MSPENWYAAFEVHVHAIFHLCRAAIPIMRKRKEGAIVLVSSTAGIRGIHTNVAYQVVKGALPQFTRALAREFANDNIRVNCVAPGVIRTRFHANMSEQQKKLNLEQRIPLRREGTPEQVATLITELIENDYITGQTVTIDGGLTMRIALAEQFSYEDDPYARPFPAGGRDVPASRALIFSVPLFFLATRQQRKNGGTVSAVAPHPPQPFGRECRRKDQGRWGQRPSPQGFLARR